MKKLPVMEHFYTIQGEGAYTGFAAYFVRLGGCDVGCTWCDVKDSWDASKHPVFSIDEILEWVLNSGANRVVVTGGEPAMYDLNELVDAFKKKQIFVHIETSAAHEIKGTFDWVTISPKKFKFPLDNEMSKAHELKIIVYNKSDFEWAEKWAQCCSSSCKLYLQPEWDRRDVVMNQIIDYVKINPHWQISQQTHKYLGIP
jgi:organic radical activating enzyme